jgi:hypothetical protein
VLTLEGLLEELLEEFSGELLGVLLEGHRAATPHLRPVLRGQRRRG